MAWAFRYCSHSLRSAFPSGSQRIYEDKIDVRPGLAEAHVGGAHDVHADVVLDPVFDQACHLLHLIQAIFRFLRLEHPVELFDIFIELDLRDVGELLDLHVEILSGLQGIVPLPVNDLLDPSPFHPVIIGDIVDPVLHQFFEDNLLNFPSFNLQDIEAAPLRNPTGQKGNLAKVGRIQVNRPLADLESPVAVNMAGQAGQDGLIVAEIAHGGRTGGTELGYPVMNTVGWLVGDNDVGLRAHEKVEHLIYAVRDADAATVGHHVTLRNAGRPGIRPAVTGYLQTIPFVTVEVQVPVVQGSIFEIHVVVSRQAEGGGLLLDRHDVLQDLVFLLQHPAGTDRVLLVFCPLLFDISGNVRHFQQFIHKILDQHFLLAHANAQAVEK